MKKNKDQIEIKKDNKVIAIVEKVDGRWKTRFLEEDSEENTFSKLNEILMEEVERKIPDMKIKDYIRIFKKARYFEYASFITYTKEKSENSLCSDMLPEKIQISNPKIEISENSIKCSGENKSFSLNLEELETMYLYMDNSFEGIGEKGQIVRKLHFSGLPMRKDEKSNSSYSIIFTVELPQNN